MIGDEPLSLRHMAARERAIGWQKRNPAARAVAKPSPLGAELNSDAKHLLSAINCHCIFFANDLDQAPGHLALSGPTRPLRADELMRLLPKLAPDLAACQR